ncbi:MAG: 4Fe-4S binding protein [Clostridiales bacterium]|jgi:2-oxoglutarate ferredoxin oxidoreductase subunit delta|nr:4Fe-4S binding protein [Clostridiales bacterium]
MGRLAKIHEPYEINVKNEWCKGCGICVGFCSRNVLAMNADGKAYAQHPEKCVGCNKCEIYCPDFAISLGGLTDGADRKDKVISR